MKYRIKNPQESPAPSNRMKIYADLIRRNKYKILGIKSLRDNMVFFLELTSQAGYELRANQVLAA